MKLSTCISAPHHSSRQAAFAQDAERYCFARIAASWWLYSIKRGKHMYLNDLASSIEGAFGADELDCLARAVWQGHGAGNLSDSEAQELAERIASRRSSHRMPLQGSRKSKDGHSSILATVPAKFNKRRHGSPESLQRRRRLAFSGPLPPALAASFTVAELAALRIIGDEVRSRGRCVACHDEIAARAGISRSSAKNAVREAVRLGLISRQERRYRGRRSDPNIITIISREWLVWLSRGPRDRGQNRDHHEYKIENKAQGQTGESCGKVPGFTLRSVRSTRPTLQSVHGSSAHKFRAR